VTESCGVGFLKADEFLFINLSQEKLSPQLPCTDRLLGRASGGWCATARWQC
jgi:hypothetical protein